mmetsp:Transcript_10471/g.18878  ORF Transcript_10471/g.18878 Transcript_10471/m.18878 type:complete len:282 (+) Transcript_10471:1293-2138(+)
MITRGGGRRGGEGGENEGVPAKKLKKESTEKSEKVVKVKDGVGSSASMTAKVESVPTGSQKSAKVKSDKASTISSGKLGTTKLEESKKPNSKPVDAKKPKETTNVVASGAADAVVEKEPEKKKDAEVVETKPGPVKVGDLCPDIELETEVEGKFASLRSLSKDNGLIVFMYPKANTPGCTKQACGYNEHLNELEKAGYKVIGLSADKSKSQLNWKTKYSLGYSFLCDPKYELIKKLGAFKSPSGIKRSHVVIAKGGIVQQIVIQTSPLDSVNSATDFVKSL